MDVEVKMVVVTRFRQRGDGKKTVFRLITEVWDAETGEKIAENDPCPNDKVEDVRP